MLYMDSLNLFAKTDMKLHVLLCTVKMFSDDVGLLDWTNNQNLQ